MSYQLEEKHCAEQCTFLVESDPTSNFLNVVGHFSSKNSPFSVGYNGDPFEILWKKIEKYVDVISNLKKKFQSLLKDMDVILYFLVFAEEPMTGEHLHKAVLMQNIEKAEHVLDSG